MASRSLTLAEPVRREERIGLGIAIAFHVALAAFLVSRDPPRSVEPTEERMVVNLSEDVGLEDTAPVPVPESRVAVAPDLSQETVAPPEPEVAPPLPPLAQPAAEPPPRPAPQSRATPQPQPRPTPRARQTSAPAPRPTAAARAADRPRQAASRIGSDFLAGAGNAQTQESRPPASRAGARAQAAYISAITRQIKAKWRAPSGLEVEKLVTTVTFEINEDGSLRGQPRKVGQAGVNDVNRAQSALHSEWAIRAIRNAAPFDLPAGHNLEGRPITIDFDRNT